MTKNTLPAALLLLIIVSGGAAAEGLTLDKAIETAIANNGDLQREAVSYRQVKRAKDYGWNRFLTFPSTIDLGVSNNHQLYSAAGAAPRNTSANWPLSGELTLGASFRFSTDAPNQLKRLDIEYQQAGEKYEQSVRDLSARVTSSFYALLAEKMNIAILSADTELKKAQYDQADANYNRGLSSELDTLNAQYAYLTAGLALDTAKSRYNENLAAFFLLIGLDAGTDIEPEGTIEIPVLNLPPVEELTSRYLMSHSVVRNQMNALEQARMNAASNVAKLGPSLAVSETLSFSVSSQTGFQFGDPALSGRFQLMVSIPLGDLLPFSSAGISRTNDRENVAAAESGLESALKSAAQDIQKKFNAVVQNSASIESSDLNYRIAARAYELTEQGYRSGLVSQTDLLSANQKVVGAEQSTVTAKIAYLTAVSNLALALNLDIADLYALYAEYK
jgi:outer membrane protein TolC